MWLKNPLVIGTLNYTTINAAHVVTVLTVVLQTLLTREQSIKSFRLQRQFRHSVTSIEISPEDRGLLGSHAQSHQADG